MSKSSGTINYRAPETIQKVGWDPKQADVFSLGVTLFIILSGIFPFTEEGGLYEMKEEDGGRYWRKLERLVGKDLWSGEFRELFEGMTRREVGERWGLEKVREAEWMKGEVMEDGEVREFMEKLI